MQILIQIWSKAGDSAFLKSPLMMQVLLVPGPKTEV